VAIRVYLLWCGGEQLDKAGVDFRALRRIALSASFNYGTWSIQKNPHPCKKRKGPPKFRGEEQLQKQRASGGLLGGALALLGDFCEFAGFYVVDEAAYRDIADVGVVLDAGDLAADVLLEIFEGVEVRWDDG
jgi:hypothetical protein